MSDSCSCNNEPTDTGELTFAKAAVQDILRSASPTGLPADRWLFELLTEAALKLPEGYVWRSGGKFIMSAGERNQSPNAVLPMLQRYHATAGEALSELVRWTEKRFDGQVVAVQINLHKDQE